jgi:hypothetical protein
MKNIILSAFIAFTICLGGAYSQTATTAIARLQPKWTLRLPSQITLSDGTLVSGIIGEEGAPAIVDSAGNAAFSAGTDTITTNGTYQSFVLWISSRGKLLAAIPEAQALSISGTAICVYEYNTASLAKYSLVNGRLIKSLPPDGLVDNALYITAQNPGLQKGTVGITQSGNITSLSCFLY